MIWDHFGWCTATRPPPPPLGGRGFHVPPLHREDANAITFFASFIEGQGRVSTSLGSIFFWANKNLSSNSQNSFKQKIHCLRTSSARQPSEMFFLSEIFQFHLLCQTRKSSPGEHLELSSVDLVTEKLLQLSTVPCIRGSVRVLLFNRWAQCHLCLVSNPQFPFFNFSTRSEFMPFIPKFKFEICSPFRCWQKVVQSSPFTQAWFPPCGACSAEYVLRWYS